MIRPKRLIFGHGPVIGPVRFQLVFGRLAGTGKEPKAEAELKIINDEAWAWGGPLALERSWGADFLGLAPQAGMSRAVGAGSFPIPVCLCPSVVKSILFNTFPARKIILTILDPGQRMSRVPG